MRLRKIHAMAWPVLLLALALGTAGACVAQPYGAPPAGAMSGQPSSDPYRDAFDEGGRGFKRPPLAWNQLNQGQKDFLRPLRSQWDTLPPWRQHRMAERVEEWRRLPPDRQAMIQQRFERLAQMTPEQRREAAQGQRRFQSMPPAERQRAFNDWFRSLSPEQKRSLIQRFRAEQGARRAGGMQPEEMPPRR